MSSQVAVNLVELNTEAADLDLIISSASDCAITGVIQEITQVTGSVDSVSWALVVLSPGLLGEVGNFVIGLNPLLVIDEPVVNELFLGLLGIIQIPVQSHVSETSTRETKGGTYLGQAC